MSGTRLRESRTRYSLDLKVMTSSAHFAPRAAMSGWTTGLLMVLDIEELGRECRQVSGLWPTSPQLKHVNFRPIVRKRNTVAAKASFLYQGYLFWFFDCNVPGSPLWPSLSAICDLEQSVFLCPALI